MLFPAIKSKRTVVMAMNEAKKVISANLTLNCFYLRRCIAHKNRENISNLSMNWIHVLKVEYTNKNGTFKIEHWKIPPVNWMRSKSFSTLCRNAYLWWIKWYYCLFFGWAAPGNGRRYHWIASQNPQLHSIIKISGVNAFLRVFFFSFTFSLAFHFEWTSFIIDPNQHYPAFACQTHFS